MYKNILAAVNEFTNSEIAARYAIILARGCGARLTLLHVADEKAGLDALRRAQAALERLFLEAKKNGVEVEKTTATGDRFKKIAEEVREKRIDVVFTATRHEDVKKRFFVKTLSEKLMQDLPCAVLMVRVVNMKAAIPSNITLALGGLAPGAGVKALLTARLAQGTGSHVTLLHLPKPETGLFDGKVVYAPAANGQVLPADMREAAGVLDKAGVAYESRVASGSALQGIVSHVVLRKTDLLIVGSGRKKPLSDFIERILHATPCNLMVFRP